MAVNYLLELPVETGRIVSPLVKLIVSGSLFIITFMLYRRHQEKQTILTRNMMLMMFFYALAPLITSFDILLGWQDVNIANSYLGIGIGVFFNGIGNSFWLWFNLEVFLEEKIPKPQQKKYVGLFLIGELVAGAFNLIFRLNGLWYWRLFIGLHTFLCLVLFFTIFKTSKNLIIRVDPSDPHYNKLRGIFWAAMFGLGSIILFAIDTFSNEVTLYSVVGWLLLIGMCYFIYRGYV